MEPKQQPPYPLRMSPELRERLEIEAGETKRSLNAEITDRLERSFEQVTPGMESAALMYSLAKAEQDAAARGLESVTRLLRGGALAHAVLRLITVIGDQEIEVGMTEEQMDDLYANAYQLAHEADQLVENGKFDDAMEAAERADRRRVAAREAMQNQLTLPTVVSETLIGIGAPRKDGSKKLTVEQVTKREVLHRDERKPSHPMRRIPVEVKKKRTFVKRPPKGLLPPDDS